MGDGDCNTEWGRMPPSPFPLLKLWRRRYREDKNMANCETCKNVQNAPENVPYSVHELPMASMERQIKRLWITVIIAVCLLFASNAGWMIYESQFATISYEQDGEGINNANLGEQGDLNNGATSEVQEEETNGE